jgi:leader peptidase (prepilin peptidase)/N-methyltransferase
VSIDGAATVNFPSLNVFTIEYGVVLAGLFIIGSVFGSLLNVCIYRLPREERFWQALRYLIHPPSHCPRCRQRIRWSDNIPILGWLLLRGRCRNCRGTIAVRYPLIEFLTGALFAIVYWLEVPDGLGPPVTPSSVSHVFGPGAPFAWSWMSPVVMLHCRYAVHLVFVVTLIVATFIDIDLRIIPDTVTLPAMAVGVFMNWLLGQVYIVPVWYQTPAMKSAADLFGMLLHGFVPPAFVPNWFSHALPAAGVPAWIAAHPHLHGLCLSLAGIIVGGGVIWAIRIAGEWALKREAMGFGDVVLVAMIGSFLGWQATVALFLLSLILALVVTIPLWLIWRDQELPYGPYLSLGALLLLLFGRRLWPWFDTQVFAMGPLLLPVALFLAVSLAGLLAGWRRVQRLLGWAPPAEPEFIEGWLPGDQLMYLACESVDDRQGQWPRCEWPGRLAARGQAQHHTWRCHNCRHPSPTWRREQ